ncbi:MAG: flagellar hook-basal body complex protein FliE [Oscillospiraceae bacterium]|jgi:flagellar hook-basal body complex protein FliE|nr:flagellar hook-basal body complex protein FliE [Oscillospiraceae bacterium]
MSIGFANNTYAVGAYKAISTISTTVPAIAGPSAPAEPSTFGGILSGIMAQTNAAEAQTHVMDTDVVTGLSDDLHSVLIAGEKADILLNLTVQIRNKLVESYQEIMRMQI